MGKTCRRLVLLITVGVSLVGCQTVTLHPGRPRAAGPGAAAENGGEVPPAGARSHGENLSNDLAPDAALPAWEFLTDTERAFAPLLADPREEQIRVGFMHNRQEDSFLDLVLGDDYGLVGARFSEDQALSLSIRGLLTGRFQFGSPSFDLLNTDFIGGAALGYKHGQDSFELFYYHQSSHLGDEILDRGERRRISYSLYTVRCLWSHEFDDLRVYGGPSFKVWADPEEISERATFQFGAEYHFSVGKVPLYVALDCQSKEEHDWDVNVAAQLGVHLGSRPRALKRQRLFLEVFNGFSSMGQFYDERESFVMLGLGFNF